MNTLFLDKKTIAKNFSSSAQSYLKQASIQQDVGKRMIHWILKKNSFQKILDIGCGPGFLSFLLASKMKHGFIKAIDFSPGMIDYAKKNYYHPLIEYSIEDIEFFSEPVLYDLIVSNACFHWLADLEKTFFVLKKKLEKNGKLFFSLYLENSYHEIRNIIKSYNPLYQMIHSFYSHQTILFLLKKLGFLVVFSLQQEIIEPFAHYAAFSKKQKQLGSYNIFKKNQQNSFSYGEKKKLFFFLNQQLSSPFTITHHLGLYQVTHA